MAIDFNSDKGSFSGLGKFIPKVLPTEYDDALSYAEVLGKVLKGQDEYREVLEKLVHAYNVDANKVMYEVVISTSDQSIMVRNTKDGEVVSSEEHPINAQGVFRYMEGQTEGNFDHGDDILYPNCCEPVVCKVVSTSISDPETSGGFVSYGLVSYQTIGNLTIVYYDTYEETLKVCSCAGNILFNYANTTIEPYTGKDVNPALYVHLTVDDIYNPSTMSVFFKDNFTGEDVTINEINKYFAKGSSTPPYPESAAFTLAVLPLTVKVGIGTTDTRDDARCSAIMSKVSGGGYLISFDNAYNSAAYGTSPKFAAWKVYVRKIGNHETEVYKYIIPVSESVLEKYNFYCDAGVACQFNIPAGSRHLIAFIGATSERMGLMLIATSSSNTTNALEISMGQRITWSISGTTLNVTCTGASTNMCIITFVGNKISQIEA